MNGKITIEEIIETLEKVDETVRPFILYLNPEDAELLRNTWPNIEKRFVFRVSHEIEHGKCFVIERHDDDYLRFSEVTDDSR